MNRLGDAKNILQEGIRFIQVGLINIEMELFTA